MERRTRVFRLWLRISLLVLAAGRASVFLGVTLYPQLIMAADGATEGPGRTASVVTTGLITALAGLISSLAGLLTMSVTKKSS